MTDRILEIVIYLMDYMRESQEYLPVSEDFSSNLRTLGYSDYEITSAYQWLLNRMEVAGQELYREFPNNPQSVRILTDSERAHMTVGAQGVLLKLLNLGLIDDEEFETIIERVTVLSDSVVTSDQVKLVASSVVFGGDGEFPPVDLIDSDGNGSTLIN
jgi:uncharacterized protein Smg (DUF494 family)